LRPESEISRSSLVALIVAQLASLLPYVSELPLWLFTYWGIALAWRVQIYRGAMGFPRAWMKFAMAIMGIVGLYLSFPSVFSVDALVAFLFISFSLKLIEVHEKKDAVLLVSVGFMSLASYFLFSQSLGAGLYFIIATILLLNAWMGLYRERSLTWAAGLKQGAVFFLQALPLMLVLFISLPRLGQLWHMPAQGKQATTGFSDSMSPGEISSLIQSNEVAFRVSFELADRQSLPAPSERYWRALVLDDFDGRRWRRSPNRSANPYLGHNTASPRADWGMTYAPNSRRYQYSVLLEPHYQNWLFTMMSPYGASSSMIDLRYDSDTLIRSRAPVSSRTHYQVVSFIDYAYSSEALDETVRTRNLKLPAGNEATREIALQWAEQAKLSSQQWELQVVELARQFYQSSFSYTLRPPTLGNNGIDEFLFESQSGFCEHFSGSFVFLMRAAGIPARVVLGYQGGDVNPVEEYLIVRQRDAHAWAEVWVEGRGWLRVDPTAAVAPSRIEEGIAGAVGDEESSLVAGFHSNNVFAKSARWLQMRIDAASYSWQRWVLNYDNDTQSSFFKRFLGGYDAWRIGVFFILGSGACVVFYYFAANWMFGAREKVYPESLYYERHLKLLARKGHNKEKGESATHFAQRISTQIPTQAAALLRVASAYELAAYSDDPAALERLKRACRDFKRSG
jgi:transglutaminase-like putative cysteine protease